MPFIPTPLHTQIQHSMGIIRQNKKTYILNVGHCGSDPKQCSHMHLCILQVKNLTTMTLTTRHDASAVMDILSC